MQSKLPSGPKPTKETYLANLRVLKEQHISLDEPMRSPASKSFKNRILLCSEDVIHPLQPAETNVGERKPASTMKLGSKMGDKDEGAESQPASQPGQGTTKSVKISNESSQKKNCSTKLREPQLVTKFGRKATLRFQTVAKRLPKYHFDLAIKQKIATELKSMNCWSDDDDFESSKLFKSRSGDESDDSDSDGSYGFEEKVPKHSAASDKRGSQISITTTSKSMKNVGFNGSSASIKENILTFSVKANKSSKSGKHAYLEQQKEKQRIETRERLVKKAIKLILQIRKAEEDALKRRQMEGKLTPEQKLAIQKTAALRVGRIVARGLSMAVETRVKAHRRERRHIARNQRAYLVIATAYRKYRVRILLQCVVDFIRLKAFWFREQQMREEREFRMRTAMRRVREDSAMKEWQDEQTRVPTFPVKPTSPTAVRVDSFLQSIQKETIATIRKSRYLFNLGTSTQDKEALLAVEAARKAEKLKMATLQKAPAAVLKEVPKSEVFLTAEGVLTDSGTPRSAFASSTTPLPPSHAVAVPFTPAPPKKAKPVAAVKAVHKTAQQMHFDFHRPNLAPFSTHINNMIMAHSTYFQQQQQQQKSALHADASSSSSSSWVDVASVGSDYLATFKKTKKSPAYCALEKFCGISQEEVIRSKLISPKEGVDMKLKSFGHSIVSL